MMINAKEMLMKGDLVYNHRKWVCPVLGFDEDSVIVNARHYGKSTYMLDDVSPIDITEDIIKQLGYEETGTDNWHRKTFKHPWYTSTLNIQIGSITGLFWIINGEFPIRYVQDLQHVLRHTVAADIAYDDEKKEYYLFDVEYNDRYTPEAK